MMTLTLSILIHVLLIVILRNNSISSGWQHMIIVCLFPVKPITWQPGNNCCGFSSFCSCSSGRCGSSCCCEWCCADDDGPRIRAREEGRPTVERCVCGQVREYVVHLRRNKRIFEYQIKSNLTSRRRRSPDLKYPARCHSSIVGEEKGPWTKPLSSCGKD